MEVFHCVPDGEKDTFPMWEGPCGSEDAPSKLSRCKKVLAAWAIGAGPFVYPEASKLGSQSVKMTNFNQSNICFKGSWPCNWRKELLSLHYA
jgi:hypothetical protein